MSTFSSATNFPVGTLPNSVVVGDFNKDGKPDIATSNGGGSSNGISILLGTGTGSFGSATNYGSYFDSLALGDFNSDGNLDIVAPQSSGGEFPSYKVAILLGTGTGSFGTATNFDTGAYRPSSVAVSDFNGDSKPDLATANTAGNVSILLGTGTGSFGVATNFNVGTNPQSVVAGDFNADGKLDLATANYDSNNVSILLGTGTGSFEIPINIDVGTKPQSVVAGDFNADGKLDLATANNQSNNVSILLGTGTGSFGAATNFNAGTSPYSVTVGDFNSDNKSDLAVANSGTNSNNASILLGDGTGSFGAIANFGAGTNPYSVAVGDFNADGKTDLATANNNSNNVSVLLNNTPAVNFGAAAYSATEGNADIAVNIPVTVSSSPVKDLTVAIALNPSSTATQNSDYTFSPATLTFSAGTNTLTQNVAVTVKADNIPENSETAVFSFGTITDGIAGTTNQATLTIPANDAIDYAIAAGTASISEGNSGNTPVTFTVTRSGGIDAASSVNYSIGGTATDSSDYNNIGGTSGGTSITGTVNFATGETSKTITLDVLGDAIIEPDETITVTLSNPVAPGLTPTITTADATTTIGNDDTAGVTVNPASGLVTTEAGDSATFTVKLNSQPSANVSIDLSSSNPAEGTVSSNSLTFTPANWNELQTVKLTGVDDSIADGSKTYNIVTAATVSNDSNYSNLNPDDVSASNSDNETPGITINPASTNATEGGANGSYSVQLNTQPTAPVTINLATGSQIQPITALSFTATNWNVAQTVAVAAVDDNAVEGNHPGAIDHTATSTDTNYNSITISPVSVAITDNDNTPTPTPALPTPTPALPTPTPALPTPTPALPTPTPALPTPTPALPTPTPALPTPTPALPTPTPALPTPTPALPTPTPALPTPTPALPTPTPALPTPTPALPTPTPPLPTPISTLANPTPAANDPIWCGLETGLNQLDSIVNDQLRQTKLPILGRLSDVSPNFVGDFKNSLVNAVKNASDLNPSQLQATIQNALGSNFSVQVSGNSSPDDSNLQITIGKKYKLDSVKLADDLGLPGLGLKVEQPPKKIFESVGNFSPAALQNIQLANSDSNSNSELQLSGKSINKLELLNSEQNSFKTASNLLPQSQVAIPANFTNFLAPNLLIEAPLIDYELSIGIGVSKDFGCYIDTDRTKVKADLNFGLTDKFKAKADLGLLEAEFQDDEYQNPTEVKGNFEVKLKDLDNLGGADDGNRLTLSELNGSYQSQDLFQSSVTANANLGLQAKTSINGDAAIPSYKFDLAVKWPKINYQNGELKTPFNLLTSELVPNTPGFNKFNPANTTGIYLSFDPSNFADNPFAGLPKPTVNFNNIKLDLGTFVSNFAKPVLAKVADIIEPFRPVIEFLNTDTKLLSKLDIAEPFDKNRDGQVTVLELASTLSGGSLVTDFLDAVVEIDSVSQLATEISNTPGNLVLNMGSYRLGNIDVSQSNASLKNATSFLMNSSYGIDQQLNSIASNPLGKFVNAFPKIKGLEAPILKDPNTAINLLLGKDIPILTYDMPPLEFNFDISQKFPIIWPLTVSLQGNLSGSADLAFGYDTYGLKEWKKDKFSDDSAIKVLDGFYVSDRANADGTGEDVDELKLSAKMAVGAGLDVEFLSGYFNGGIEGRVGIDLVDIGENNGTSDGKIRGYEIGSRISKPEELFNVLGQINAFLSAEVELFGKTILDESFATFQLAKFGVEPSSEQVGTIKIAKLGVEPSPEKVGTVTNSYITGAKVFFDANFNGIQDEQEPFTINNVDGSFSLDISLPKFDKNNSGELEPDEGRIVVADGINTATYLPQQTPLTATPDATVVTPLTTLMEKMVAQGINPHEAETKVKAAFGVPSTIDLTAYDPLQAITQNDPNGLAVYAAHIQVQNVVVLTTILISGISANSKTDIADRIISTIANQIQSGAVDLTNPAQLQSIIQSAATQLQAQKASDIAPEVAKIIAEGNQRVRAIASSNLPLSDAATKIAQVQQVEQGEVAKDLQQVAAGNKTIQEAIAENTGTSLDAQIQSANVNNPTIRKSINSDFTATEPFPDSGIELVNNSPNQKIGTDGDDTLGGDSSDDVLSGKKGNDLIFGFNGNDWINANQGNDLINGGFDDDTLYGGKGIDTITGSDGGDIIFGNRGDDLLDGSTDNDTLRGGKGNDTIIGGDGDDFLFCEDGDDTLIGGNGSDRFLLSPNSGIDIIWDFQDGKDLLYLGNNLTFSQLSLTQENSTTFIRSSVNGEILAALNGVSASLINVADFG